MNRIALGIEYDGSRFHGWQYQASVSSVQNAVETALSQVAAQPITVVCAGRTDAGVHATAQVVHFNTTAIRNERAWIMGTNASLPSEVRVLWARPVPETFNARRSAVLRRYRYILYNYPIRPGLLRKQVGWYYRALDASLMNEAAQYWVGEHDFSSFRAAECQSTTPIRRMVSIEIKQIRDVIIIDVAANAFLHHMVRNMVGALIRVGSGKANPFWAKEVLEARDRRKAGITAPPNGLYLVSVEYPAHFGLPENKVLGPWFLT
jgi:tRNA pseudouridine38-40 synthase